MFKNSSGLTVGNSEKISEYLSQREVKEIVYDVPYGSEIGIQYMLRNIPKNDAGKVVHVSYPHDLSFDKIKHFSDVAVWVDDRTEEKNYLSTNTYFLSSNPSYLLLKNSYPKNVLDDYDVYAVIKDNQVIGELFVAHESKNKLEWVRVCEAHKTSKNYEWTPTEKLTQLRFSNAHCMQLRTNEDFTGRMDELGIEIF